MSQLPMSDLARRTAVVLGITLLFATLAYIVFATLQVLLVLFAGIVLGVFFISNARWITRLTGLSYRQSLTAQLVVMLALGIASIALLAQPVSEQLWMLGQKLPESVARVEGWVRQFEIGKAILDQTMTTDTLVNRSDELIKPAHSFLYGTTAAIAGLLILAFIAIYLAASPDLYLTGAIRLVPIRHRPRAQEVLGRVGYVLLWWTYGKLAEMVLVGVLTFVGLWLLGVPLAMSLALLAAAMAFIPNFGPVIALVPAVLLALLQGPATAGWVIVLYLGIQTLESYLVTPLVQQRTVDLPPVLTITAQLMLALLAGFMGLAMATPLMAAVLAAVQMVYVNDILGDPAVQPDPEEMKIVESQA